MEDQAIVVLVTAPDQETGREIGRILVEKGWQPVRIPRR
jgi:uncharacterized protein involved in tolerance to divalent cations